MPHLRFAHMYLANYKIKGILKTAKKFKRALGKINSFLKYYMLKYQLSIHAKAL